MYRFEGWIWILFWIFAWSNISQSQQLVYTLVGHIRNVVEKLLEFEDIESVDENLL
jgi:hypothetical protein